jgi:hydrophobic/amphiphilic exporter-1 (mainly G- bacteria), HAE1 family
MRLIRTLVENSVAANMLMLIILGGGLMASFLIPRELLPEFSVDVVTVSVPYPGAPPEDIEKGICLKVEDYLANVEGIKEISSTSREGVGVVALELETSADVRKVLDDVKSEVDKIAFPDNAEDPIVREATIKGHVIQVAVFGDAPERTLKEIAEDVRDELIDLPAISQVAVSGVRAYEIAVEIDEEALRRHGIGLDRVARAIRDSSFDLPAGEVKTRAGEFALRIVGQKYTAREFEGIPVLYEPDGTVIYLRDLGNVREAFEDLDIGGQFNGQPAALVGVYKTSDEDTIKISRAVNDYVEAKRGDLPEGIGIATWSDLSKLVSDRLNMLVRNGIQGLVLVVLVLWLFLGLRLSIWVALGIPVSLLGTILVMNLTGLSLNMLSMFALIMALGLIVDDAIVVGENVYSRFQRGEAPELSAIDGTHEVLLPVLGAVLTTWMAFIPLFFIPGIMGRFIRQMPTAVILTLAFSLLECLLILPSHLNHSLAAQQRGRRAPTRGILGRWSAFSRALRDRVDRVVETLIYVHFRRLFQVATRYRYVTMTLFLGILVVMVGAFKGGWIRQTTFPKMESDVLRATLVLPTGTPLSRTAEVARRIQRGAERLNEQFPLEDDRDLVMYSYTLLGQQSGPSGQQGGHVAEMIVELLPSEQRNLSVRTDDLIDQWRRNVGAVSDALSLQFGSFRGGPGGKPLEIRVLANNTDEAKEIAERIKVRLATYDGVYDIEDDALPGKMEIQVRPTRAAYALKINQQILAAQLRDAFYGNESIEIQRGRDEIKVMVRYPEQRRRSIGSLESKRIRTPDGDEVPFTEVADMTMARGYTTLRRLSGRSVVTVSADINEQVANAEKILEELGEQRFFEDVTADMPGARVDLAGQRKQSAESLGALFVWFPVALLAVYTILATIFRSYLQPLIVMVAIPFGLIGAVLGHWLMDFDVTLLSLFGMVALAGIVVNDSLVLIDRVNREARAGAGVHAAVETGATRRFRAILLTTITTVAGMTPLLMERSFQAQFLKPMAISITFGLAFATMLTLVLVPCLYLIGNDIRRAMRWLRTGRWPAPEDILSPSGTPNQGKVSS